MNEVSKQTELEGNYRSSLQDVIVVAQKLSPYCKTVDELLSMVQLALENDGQLRLLITITTQKK